MSDPVAIAIIAAFQALIGGWLNRQSKKRADRTGVKIETVASGVSQQVQDVQKKLEEVHGEVNGGKKQ